MGFGASLAFIAIGAVLAFAVKWDVPGIDLQMIGWILMGVGVVGALLTGLYTRRPRTEEIVETVEPDTVYITGTTDANHEDRTYTRGSTYIQDDTHVSERPHSRARHDETREMPHVRREDL